MDKKLVEADVAKLTKHYMKFIEMLDKLLNSVSVKF